MRSATKVAVIENIRNKKFIYSNYNFKTLINWINEQIRNNTITTQKRFILILIFFIDSIVFTFKTLSYMHT